MNLKLNMIVNSTDIDGEEYTIVDKDYDIECYFYNDMSGLDDWNIAMNELMKIIDVDSISGNGTIVCKIYDLIDSHIDELNESNLFCVSETEDFMEVFPQILAGYTRTDTFVKFVDILKK